MLVWDSPLDGIEAVQDERCGCVHASQPRFLPSLHVSRVSSTFELSRYRLLVTVAQEPSQAA